TLENALIQELTEAATLGVREGIVMTIGPRPYRRLDCDGCALAYVRTRPRKNAVRVDISGLWLARQPSRLMVPNSGGAATLLIRGENDRLEAVAFIGSVITETRARRMTHARNRMPYPAGVMSLALASGE